MAKRILVFLLIIVCFSPACVKVEKNVNSYYPKVKTTSVTKNADGSATVYGEVTFAGSTPIEFCGFCMDTVDNPDMLSNQVLSTNLTGNIFSFTYSSFNAVKTYYFRAFAANANGYAIGSTVSASNISFDTSQIPCHPTSQHLSLAGIHNEYEPYSYVTAITQSGTGYDVMAQTGSHQIDITFGQYPTSGVYTSANTAITIDGVAATGATNIYVQQISNGVIDITICQANVSITIDFTGTYYPYVLTTKFRSPS